MEIAYPKPVAVSTQPSFHAQSEARWDSQYNILLVDMRHTMGNYLNAPYFYTLEGGNVIQLVMQTNDLQEVLSVEVFGAKWQVSYEQSLPDWVESRNIILSPESWTPMRKTKSNKSYYIDLQSAITFSVDPNYKVFKVGFAQEVTNKTSIFAASPHLLYRVSQQNTLQEMWILLTG